LFKVHIKLLFLATYDCVSRLPPALHPASRFSHKAVHRQHGDDACGKKLDIEFLGDYGRAETSASLVPTPRVGFRNTPSALGAQPTRRQVVEEATSCRLSFIAGWSSGALVSRGFRSKPKIEVEKCGSAEIVF
jgi:hypothetical protein